jgi:hypothetical protein
LVALRLTLLGFVLLVLHGGARKKEGLMRLYWHTRTTIITHQAHALECGSSSYEFVRELGLVVAIVDFLVRIAREETHVEKVELIGSCGREGELWPR